MKKIILALAILFLVIVLAGYKIGKPSLESIENIFSKNKTLTTDQAKVKVADYINNNLVQPGTKVDIKSVTAEGDLYKVALNVQGQDITAYMTKDGSKFFPNAMDMTASTPKPAADSSASAPQKDIAKSDTPVVKLFVMSYCPYGTQIEKGILPALSALGNKIKFSLEFVSYSMHNDLATNDRKELDENMRQYCIQKNQPEKLQSYLTCFLKKGQGTENDCMTQTGVNATQVESCKSQTDTQFNVTKDFNDKSTYQGQFPLFEVNKDDNTKYGVQGSPTLVINDTVDQSAGRDSASLLKSICSAFNTAPDACNQQLSSTAPSPGFGEGTAAAGGSSASCGN
jgi:hypothetical protein